MPKKSWLKVILISTLVLTIVFYAVWQLRHVVGGPAISITSPAPGFVADKPLVEITGQAEQIDFLYLNGRQIFTDEEGQFSEKYLAAPGYNVIQLVGKDKFGRQTTEMVEFVINNQQQ